MAAPADALAAAQADRGGVWTSNSTTPGWQIESVNPQILRLLENGAPGG